MFWWWWYCFLNNYPLFSDILQELQNISNPLIKISYVSTLKKATFSLLLFHCHSCTKVESWLEQCDSQCRTRPQKIIAYICFYLMLEDRHCSKWLIYSLKLNLLKFSANLLLGEENILLLSVIIQVSQFDFTDLLYFQYLILWILWF